MRENNTQTPASVFFSCQYIPSIIIIIISALGLSTLCDRPGWIDARKVPQKVESDGGGNGSVCIVYSVYMQSPHHTTHSLTHSDSILVGKLCSIVFKEQSAGGGGYSRNQYLIPRTSHKFPSNYSSARLTVVLVVLSLWGLVGWWMCARTTRSCPRYYYYGYIYSRPPNPPIQEYHPKPLSNQHPLSFAMQMNVYNFFFFYYYLPMPPIAPSTGRVRENVVNRNLQRSSRSSIITNMRKLLRNFQLSRCQT